MGWAQRLKRVFGIEIRKCEHCAGAVRIIACIEDAQIIEKILQHLGLDATPAGEALPQALPGGAVRWPAASYASFQRIDPGFCHRCHRRFDRRELNAQKKRAA
jgi:hypothetical protein